MMNRLLGMIAAILAAPGAMLAQDFSANSTAQSWNLYAEQPAFFEAKVIDALCAVTGDCPADCGAGTRQMGLLRKADGVFVLAIKNNQPLFTGGANELAPFCGQDVEVDGLMLVDPDAALNNVYQVQKIRAVGSAEWTKANRWTKDWQAMFPEATGKDAWYRRDPRILAILAKSGYFGLGPEVDAAYIAAELE